MVLDTSAVVALLFGDTESTRMIHAIAEAEDRWIGAPTLVEASAVMLARKGPGGELALDALLKRLNVETVPLSETAARLARLGYARFGKGVGSPPVLNLGDCYAYGTAMALRQPLLFKGEGFRQTDVPVVEY